MSTFFVYLEGSLGALLMIVTMPLFLLCALGCSIVPKDSFKNKWLWVCIFVVLAFSIFILRNLAATFFPPSFEYNGEDFSSYSTRPAINAEP